MPRRPETWVSLCNLMLKHRGILRCSAILGSDSPQSYIWKDNYCGLFKATKAYISASTAAGGALALLLSGGTSVRHWQSAQRLWPDNRRLQLPLDDCCRLVLPYNAVHNIQQTKQIPNDPPRMGAKSTSIAIIPVPPLTMKPFGF